MKKVFAIAVVFMSCCLAFSKGKNQNLTDFFRGDIQDKINAVKKSSEAGDSSVAVQAIDFLIQSSDALAGDEDYNVLAETSIKSFNPRNSVGNEKEISAQLCSLFKMTGSQRVKIAIIDFFMKAPNSESVQLINDYFYKKMQNHEAMDEAVVNAIKFMGAKGNAASFNRLFIADILEVWPEYCPVIEESYANLAEENRREILQMVVSVPADKKILILKKLISNSGISKNICGECAENVMSSIINTYEEEKSKDKKEDIVELELLCLETIARTKWTRASSLTTKIFEILRLEYEQQVISVEQFTKAISHISAVASNDTVVVLSAYLDFLNKCTENGQPPVKDVVLSVINCLGELGDNKAFDFIYAATSLAYPEEVVDAAKSAITKLKW